MYFNLLRGVLNIVVRGGDKDRVCNNEYKYEMKSVFRIKYNSTDFYKERLVL